MARIRPHFPARMSGRQRIDRHVQDARDFCRTFLAFDSVCDRNLFYPEIFANQRRECRHGAAGSTGEDRPKGLGLLVVSALINIGSHGPVSFCHRSRRMDCERYVKAIERDAAIPATFDVKDQLGRSQHAVFLEPGDHLVPGVLGRLLAVARPVIGDKAVRRVGIFV